MPLGLFLGRGMRSECSPMRYCLCRVAGQHVAAHRSVADDPEMGSEWGAVSHMVRHVGYVAGSAPHLVCL